MKISDLFTRLALNELSSTAVVDDDSFSIVDKYYPKLMVILNDSLKDLFTRFLLLEKNTIIKTFDWKRTYQLNSKYSVRTNTNTDEAYLIDTDTNPFLDDLINILYVRDRLGRELSLNDPLDPFSAYTPRSDVLQLNATCCNQEYYISYRANHPILIWDDTDKENSLNQDINIPIGLETALRLRIAMFIFSGMSGQESSAKARDLNSLYESECSLVIEQGVVSINENRSNERLDRRGFV